MIALYTHSEPREIEISGTSNEWYFFSEMILIDDSTIGCDSTIDPFPYSLAAKGIVIRHTNSSKLTIDVEKEDILIHGNKGNFVQLAKIASSFASTFESGEHFHVDYQGDNYFISESSAATVFHLC